MSNKVFVGNLAFKTREPDLSHVFETNVAKVVSVNIISRGPRSLGYGFVEFENDEAAKHAVDVMNHKEVDGRQINVEVARPRDPNAPQPPRQQRFPRQAPRNFFPVQYGMQAPRNYAFPARGHRMDYMGMPMGAPMGSPMGAPMGAPMGTPAPQMMMPPQQGYMGMGQPRIPMPMMLGYGRPPRRMPRAPAAQDNRTPSKTTLFVANLPFIVEDENLRDIFAEFNVKEARVMRRANSKSKGYGFVELKSEEDQRRALQTLDKIEVEGRTLIIKAALTEPFRKPEPATATTASAPATVSAPATASATVPAPAPAPTNP